MNWSLHPIFESYGAVIAAAVLMLLPLLAPTYRPLTTARRAALLALRVGVILVALTLMLRPTCVTTTTQPQSRMLMLMFDRSRSMQLPDASGKRTRWEQLQELLNELEPLLNRPGEATEIKLLAFDKELAPVSIGGWSDLKPDGGQTDLGGASDQALRLTRGRRLLAVVMVSDGVQTAYDSQVDVHRAARQLGRDGVPLFTVALGPRGDATQVRDLALENLPDQLSGFIGSDLPISAVVRVQGYVGKPLQAKLSLENSGGHTTELGAVDISASEEGQLVPVQLNFSPPAVGDYKLTMSVAAQQDELVTKNNSLSCYVRIRDGLKVGYLFGTVLGEQRALRWSLSGGSNVQLVTRFINPRFRDRWPLRMSDLLSGKEVDAYIIESVPAAAFHPDDLADLAQQVSAGKGLLMLGGYLSFGPGGYRNTPLNDVLPVEMGRFERQDIGLDKPLAKDLHWAPDEGVRILPTADHPILRLAPGEENLRVWQSLPPLAGINRLEPAKFAQVLAVAQNDLPVLLTSAHGKGRVAAFAGDTTHRWWQHGHQREHQQFWRQTVMWLVGRDMPRSEVWLELSRRRFQPSEPVAIRGGVIDEIKGLAAPTYRLQLTNPAGRTTDLSVRIEDQGAAAELDAPRAAGDYTLLLVATRDGAEIGRAESSFQVIDRDVELSSPAADHEQLARLAKLTESAGGAMVPADDLYDVLRDVLSRPATTEVDTQTRWELAGTPRDAWLVMLALTALLSTEWWLRKRWGLV
ncbi:MAG: hypothetical protein KDB14_15855 [Planctomycetales bacterium]|nr:hypothetical protein [Planctomycetales bacterium]